MIDGLRVWVSYVRRTTSVRLWRTSGPPWRTCTSTNSYLYVSHATQPSTAPPNPIPLTDNSVCVCVQEALSVIQSRRDEVLGVGTKRQSSFEALTLGRSHSTDMRPVNDYFRYH